ncbi:hypothetical protein CEN47_11485 [Fischerella thermalis CCMEE 5319]|nr:hypothetical protein CEN47_11485 [Fischerella thermalis CCMEE 5319]
MSKKTQTLYIIISLLIVTGMGFLFKYYTGFAQKWFNDYGAAVFYEIFWCLFAFLFLRSSKAIIQIPLWVLIITCILEFLQLWHPPFLEQFRANLVGKLLLGTTFAWWDFPHYVVGCFLGWLWLRKLQGKSYANKGQS